MTTPQSPIDSVPCPTPTCRGYILASQHPNFPSKARTPAAGTSPYEIVPCPCEPLSPSNHHDDTNTAQKEATAKGRKHGCVVGNWCERHWCAGCKKGREEREGLRGMKGLGHGRLDIEKRWFRIRR